ncbi:MAG: helix-turn-helix domain-containing protein [Endomicrobium sp.]|jgi:excisionase family DNA binding protein|nr:helix-turn-helix domain-containing protein [Endomicrobium sp.]
MSENITLTRSELHDIIDQTISKYIEKAQPKKRGRRKYISIREFAEHFSMHKASINNLIKEGKIKAFQAFGTTAWRINASEIERYEKESIKKTKNDVFVRNF